MNNDIIVTTFASKKKSGWSMEPDTGVKIYHKPTGKEFSCEIYKSVHRNKAHCIECLEKSLVDGVSMKTFRIDREITSSSGVQSFACEASNVAEAVLIFKRGGGVLIDHEHTVEGLDGVENCEVYQADDDIGPYGDDVQQTVKVKPLVWGESWPGNDCADTTFGMLHVYKQPFKSPDRYDVESDFGIKLYGFNSLESAKQAAKEHYEKLILASIE